MISFVRTLVHRNLRVKNLSSLADKRATTLLTKTETPRLTIGKNLLLFQRLAAAKDEGSLDEITKSSVSLDVHNIPAELSYVQGYLSSPNASPASAASYNFEPDPTAWQNKPFFGALYDDVIHHDHWPFWAGAM